MSTDTPLCAMCGTSLTRTHRGDLDAWVCPTGHGLAVTLAGAEVADELWERGERAAAGVRDCPMCETSMAVVSLQDDLDEELLAVKVDLCPPCRVLWFDSNELAGVPGYDEPDPSPAADDAAVAEVRALFGERVEASAEERGDAQLAERLIAFAAHRRPVVQILHRTPSRV